MRRFISTLVAISVASTSQAAPKNEDPWVTFTKWAYYRSAQQNHGKASQTRSCQPELKLCTLAITFYDNKQSITIARDTYDENDKLVKRDVCKFNEALDIRTCVNWDTKEQTKEMKDSKGEWFLISDNHNQ